MGPRGLASRGDSNRGVSAKLQEAKKLATEGNLEGAISACQKALTEDKTLTEAYLLMGSLLDLAGHSEKSLVVYQKGLKNKAKAGPLNHAIGMLLLESKQIEDALAALTLANKTMSPPNADLKADLAYAYLLTGKTELGLKYATQARELNPKSWPAIYTQGEAYFRLQKNDLAIKAFQDAVKLAPKETSAQRRLGQALTQAKKFTEAKDVFLKLLGQNPKDIKAHAALAGVWFNLNQKDNAVKSMERARDLAPKNISVLKLLASTYDNAGMKAAAKKTRRLIKKLEENK